MPEFTESQYFRQWWIWTILAVSGVISLGFLLTKGFQPFDLVPLSIPVLLAVMLFVARLDTRIDQTGIHYRFFPFIGWRLVAWSDVQKAAVRTYPFVGYGIRTDFQTWYYNVDGQWGIHVDKTNGSQLVIGTQQPDGMRQFLATNHPVINEP